MATIALIKNGIVENLIVVDEKTDQKYLEDLREEQGFELVEKEDGADIDIGYSYDRKKKTFKEEIRASITEVEMTPFDENDDPQGKAKMPKKK